MDDKEKIAELEALCEELREKNSLIIENLRDIRNIIDEVI